GFLNSLLYSGTAMLLGTAVTTMGGYALSRSDLVGRNIFTLLFVFTMMFSGGMIPMYLVVGQLGMLNTPWAIIVPTAVSVWQLIVTRTFFQTTIPNELLETSRLDGASDLRFFAQIALPLSKPIIAVNLLLYGVATWNSYFPALIYLTDESLYPLQLIMRNILLEDTFDPSKIPGMDAARIAELQRLSDQLKYSLIILASIPPLIAYPLVQKPFVKGMMIGSLRGAVGIREHGDRKLRRSAPLRRRQDREEDAAARRPAEGQPGDAAEGELAAVPAPAAGAGLAPRLRLLADVRDPDRVPELHARRRAERFRMGGAGPHHPVRREPQLLAAAEEHARAGDLRAHRRVPDPDHPRARPERRATEVLLPRGPADHLLTAPHRSGGGRRHDRDADGPSGRHRQPWAEAGGHRSARLPHGPRLVPSHLCVVGRLADRRVQRDHLPRCALLRPSGAARSGEGRWRHPSAPDVAHRCAGHPAHRDGPADPERRHHHERRVREGPPPAEPDQPHHLAGHRHIRLPGRAQQPDPAVQLRDRDRAVPQRDRPDPAAHGQPSVQAHHQGRPVLIRPASTQHRPPFRRRPPREERTSHDHHRQPPHRPQGRCRRPGSRRGGPCPCSLLRGLRARRRKRRRRRVRTGQRSPRGRTRPGDRGRQLPRGLRRPQASRARAVR